MEPGDGMGGDEGRLLGRHQGDAGGDPQTCLDHCLLSPGINDGGFGSESLSVALPRPREGARCFTSVPHRSLV